MGVVVGVVGVAGGKGHSLEAEIGGSPDDWCIPDAMVTACAFPRRRKQCPCPSTRCRFHQIWKFGLLTSGGVTSTSAAALLKCDTCTMHICNCFSSGAFGANTECWLKLLTSPHYPGQEGLKRGGQGLRVG